MTNEEMMAKVNAVAKVKQDAKEAALLAKRNKMMADIEKIHAGLEKIRNMAPIVENLYRNGLVTKDGFLSEGIFHRCGFSTKTLSLWGITGGGCAGRSVFVNVNNGLFRVSGWYDELSVGELNTEQIVNGYLEENDYSCVKWHLECMARGIDDFCKSVEDFVSKL